MLILTLGGESLIEKQYFEYRINIKLKKWSTKNGKKSN